MRACQAAPCRPPPARLRLPRAASMAAPHAGEAALAASLAALGVDARLQPLDCSEGGAVVKSLVFTLSPGGEAVLVVVPLAAKVCTTKLGAALGRRRSDVRLATPEARAASRACSSSRALAL